MKTVKLLSAIIIGMMIIGCEKIKEKTAEEILENPKMEEQIYAAILNNNNHLTKFIDKMMVDENCKTLMTKNTSLMKMICLSENMDSLFNTDNEIMKHITNKIIQMMEVDTSVCDRTCNRMMESESIRKFFHQQIPAKGKGK